MGDDDAEPVERTKPAEARVTTEVDDVTTKTTTTDVTKRDVIKTKISPKKVFFTMSRTLHKISFLHDILSRLKAPPYLSVCHPMSLFPNLIQHCHTCTLFR